MKIRKEFIVLGLVVAALCGYLVWQRQRPTAYRLPSPPAVERDDITRIRIERPGTGPVELKKVADRWLAGEDLFNADEDKIAGLLEIVTDLDLTALVSESGCYERYHLDEARRIRVRAWAGDSLRRDFAIGKSAPTYRHTFVTLAGDEKVYHAREDFRGRFDRDLDQLRDKRVLTFERDKIRTVSLQAGAAGSATFTRVAEDRKSPEEPEEKGAQEARDAPEAPRWRREEGGGRGPVDEKTLENLTTGLASLECERYLYDRTRAELEADRPDYIIELTGEREEPYRLLLFAPLEAGGEDRERPGISSENDDPFVVSAFHSREFSGWIAKLTGTGRPAAE